jgi:hypothetical protein
LQKSTQFVGTGVNALEIIEVFTGRCKGAKRPRNISTEKKQQSHQGDKDDATYGELAALVGHRELITTKALENEERIC